MRQPVGWALPPYPASLADVLPAVIASLGVPPSAEHCPWRDPAIKLPAAGKAVVALVDGLGASQLRRRSGHAPFLRTLNPASPELRSAFPSTTATSLASFGTGLAPGQHGLIGTLARAPEAERLFSHLSWDGGPDPLAYQPFPTLLERASVAGVAVGTVSRRAFAGSALTKAALRGGQFAAAGTAQERVEATLAALSDADGQATSRLVYLYFDEVDKAGHQYGPDSFEWGEAVEGVDRTLSDLAAQLPSGTSLTVTADHGMMEAPLHLRYDLAERPELREGVTLLGGEPRAGQVFCEPGAVVDVQQRWEAVLGEKVVLYNREQAIEAGLFGPVRDEVLPRIADLVTAMTGNHTVLDSRGVRPAFLALIGHHGSLTDDETLIPFLHLPA